MSDYIIKKIERFLNFEKIGYLPRWVIFLIDTLITIISCVLVYILLQGLKVQFFDEFNALYRNIFIVSINAFFFIVFKTYSGVIRHSTIIDSIKLFTSTISSFFTILFVNYFYYYLFGDKVFLFGGLLIVHSIVFLLLILFRIFIKNFYEKYIIYSNKNDLINAVIYGSDANAISVANALKTEMPARFRLVGFIDRFNQVQSKKRILDLPILNQNKKISVILRALQAKALIIAEKSLSKEDTIALVEECLEYNIKIYTVPLIANWEDYTQISKNVKSFEIEDLLDRNPIVLNNQSISNNINGQVVLITGAAGSIGSEIVRQALRYGPSSIILLDQAESPLHDLLIEIKDVIADIKLHAVIADIKDNHSLEKIFKAYRPNIVYHAAAYKHVPLMESNPSEALLTNVGGTKNLADLSLQYNVLQFVMISTDKAVNPSSIMGASKRIAELYIQSLQFKSNSKGVGIKFITTRFGNVLGSNGSVVPLFAKQIKEGGPVTLTHPDIIRYFMTIPEACQLVLEAGAMGKGGEVFLFDMGKPVKVIDLARKMIKLAGFIPDKDIKIKIIGLRPGEKLFEELLNDSSISLPTHNKSILIAQDYISNLDSIIALVNDLLFSVMNEPDEALVLKMKKLVPEFKSQNSFFEIYD